MSDVPIDDLMYPDDLTGGTDPVQAYDSGWEEAVEEGDGLEDHLLGESPVTPEL